MKGQLLNKILFVLLLFPAYLFAQPVSTANDIAGLWKGALYDDSTKKYIPFEIAVSEEDGKLSGYSYIVFDIDGNKELGVKRIRLKRKDDQLTIEDIEFISNTYKAPPPRGVRFRSTVSFSMNDKVKLLTGRWSTNPTRQYGQNNGSIQLQQAIEYTPEALFQELVRLKLDQNLSFVKAEKKQQPDIAIIAKPASEIKLPAAIPSDSDNLKEVAMAPPQKKIEGVIDTKQAVEPAKQLVSKPVIYSSPVTITPVPEKIAEKLVLPDLALIKNRPSGELFKIPGGKRKTIIPLTAKNKEVFVSPRDKRKEEYQLAFNKAKTIIAPPVAVKTEPVAVVREPVKKPAAEIVQKPVSKRPEAIAPPVATNKPVTPAVIKEPVKTAGNPAAVVIAPAEQKTANPANLNAAAEVSERTMKNEQSVFYESDSLVLTLYDNGEVDGDTVSVLMNGQIIFARQGLTTKANSKTIYIDKSMPDSLSMIMYAENLGSIPPNTGLLIIMDGEKRYEVRFSADLKTNAAILLRRRKKEN